MRLLVVGAAGDLGTAVADEAFNRGHWRIGSVREWLDLECPDRVMDKLSGVEFDALVNCAAYHRVDEAQRELMRAYTVNAASVEEMAMACRAGGAMFTTVSTDYVFPGDKDAPYVESDPARPLSMYGLSKWIGERQAIRAWDRTLAVRTSALFGGAGTSSKGGDFVRRVLAKARRGERIEAPEDLRFAPTYVPDLAKGILDLLEGGVTGIVHAAGGGETTWADLAEEALALAGLRHTVCRIKAAENEAKGAARRPPYSVLRSERAPWGPSLADYRIGLKESVARIVGEWSQTVTIRGASSAA